MKCNNDPTAENLNNPEILQTEYDRQYDYIARGAMIRSRANWYEQGGKSKIFFEFRIFKEEKELH